MTLPKKGKQPGTGRQRSSEDAAKHCAEFQQCQRAVRQLFKDLKMRLHTVAVDEARAHLCCCCWVCSDMAGLCHLLRQLQASLCSSSVTKQTVRRCQCRL